MNYVLTYINLYNLYTVLSRETVKEATHRV